MREHARPCGVHRPAPHAAPEGIRVRAPNDPRPHRDHAARFFSQEIPMTAYLISLALIGFVVIAISEDGS